MYCGRHPVGEGSEPGTLHNRIDSDQGYESICTRDGLPLRVSEDKTGDGVPEEFRFVYTDEGIYEYYDRDGDGGLDAVTLREYNNEGLLRHSISWSGWGRGHDDFEERDLISEETRDRVTVEVWLEDVHVVQVFERDGLVSEQRHHLIDASAER